MEEKEIEVDRCKAKAKAAWLRKQERLREEWVMDVFRKTGRVPMCPWPDARGEDKKVELDNKLEDGETMGMAEKEEKDGAREMEEELMVVADRDGKEEEEKWKSLDLALLELEGEGERKKKA